MIPDACPKCGAPIQLWDKDTSTGRDMLTYGCDVCKWSETFDGGISLWKVLSDANEEPLDSTPLVSPEGTREPPDDRATSHKSSVENSDDVSEGSASAGGDSAIRSTGRDDDTERERQAYVDGYNDCVAYRHVPSKYNPTEWHEHAYKAGWRARMQEEDEQLLREWTGLQ